MRALYSLVSHARTVCALAQGIVTLEFDGWAALTPTQWLLLSSGLCLLLRIVVPSPSCGGGRWITVVDLLVNVAAVVSVAVVTIEGLVDTGLLLARLSW